MAAEDQETSGKPVENRFVLQPKLDLKGSEALAKDLQVYRGESIIVDAGQVEHFGALALQTLLVAARSWHSDGHQFRVTDLSETAVEHLAVMGMDQSAFDGERTEP